MRPIALAIFIAVAAESAGAQTSSAPTPTQTAPAPLQVDTWVLSVSASPAGRLRFWIRTPGAPPEGLPFIIRPDVDFPWGGSGVMGLLMASYQTKRPVRIFYHPAPDPSKVGEIVRVDAPRDDTAERLQALQPKKP